MSAVELLVPVRNLIPYLLRGLTKAFHCIAAGSTQLIQEKTKKKELCLITSHRSLAPSSHNTLLISWAISIQCGKRQHKTLTRK